jgi:monovalent cation/proton antiporter, MnhG/PhaG subunit
VDFSFINLSSIDFSMIRFVISSALLLFGVFDVLVGMIGLIRLPDIYNRLHATTKIATTGAFFVLLSILVYDGFTPFGLKAIAIGIFLLMTAPVAGHVIARTAYNIHIPPCDQTLFDAYSGKRQGDFCDDYDFHEGSYVYLDIERREQDQIQSDHFEGNLADRLSEELSSLVHVVTEHTEDLVDDIIEDDGEELITGSESIEKITAVENESENSKSDDESNDEKDQ